MTIPESDDSRSEPEPEAGHRSAAGTRPQPAEKVRARYQSASEA